MVLKASRGIPAVSYIRNSSSAQEASPDQQRTEVDKLARRLGYWIIREYFDPGITGDEVRKRKQFQKMLHDAQELGDFEAILCWDQSRFGRMDSVDAGEVVAPLRRAGVTLVTVAEGAINWNDFAGRMIYSIQQEGKHAFLLDLSRNVLRGKIRAARDGRGAALPPYGMDRQFHDKDGEPVKLVRYGERFTKPREWTVRFVPAQDGSADTVRWIIRSVADHGHGLGWIADDLNKRGVPSPQGKTWSVQTVAGILANRIYTGANVFGDERYGKYHRMGASGEIEQGASKIQRGEPIIVDGVHEVLIDRDIFERAQAVLADRRQSGRRPRHNHYLLSSVLRCGHCGGSLAGKGYHGRDVPRYYCCVTGATRPGVCKRYQVRQDVIEEYVLSALEEQFFAPEVVDRIRKEIAHQTKSKQPQKSQTAALKAQIKALDRKITKGNENLLLAHQRDIAGLSQVLDDWRRERERLTAEFKRATIAPAEQGSEQLAARAMRKLNDLKQAMKSANPAQVKQVIGSAIDEVRLWWEPYGKRNKRLSKGVIQFNRELEFSSPASRGR